jgi:hypothetical protein
MAYPFMPMTTKTIRKVAGAIKDSNLHGNSTKINGRFESEKIKQALEINPRPLKKGPPPSSHSK